MMQQRLTMIVSILLTAALMLTLVSCISSGNAGQNSTGDTPVETTVSGVSASTDAASADSARIDVVSINTSGDFQYRLRSDGAAEISTYQGSDSDLSIPSSLDGHPVVSIWNLAFYACNGSVTIPDSVVSIDPKAFDGSEFEKITVDQANPAYSSIDGTLYDKEQTTLIRYATGRKEASFTIPDSVTVIGDEAFSGCHSLTDVTIPDSVTTIGKSAFYYCSGLTSIVIPDSVTRVDDGAFFGCGEVTEVSIGKSVSYIGGSAFACKVPEGVFDSMLEKITVAADNPAYCSINGDLYDKDATTLIQYALAKPDKTFTVPDSVTLIESGAVSNCKRLTEVILGSGVREIGSQAFYECGCLRAVRLSDGVTDIGGHAFYGTDMKEATIPRSVTRIGSMAFGFYYDCGSDVDFTVKGYAGTAAEQYAKRCDFTFIAIDG